jgi:hypothetical protein
MIPTHKGKWSTARNSSARKPVFQPNPKIRCLVLDYFQKKNYRKINISFLGLVRLGKVRLG